MKFCNNCGKQVPDDIKYCKFCGSDLREKDIYSNGDETVNLDLPESRNKKIVLIKK